MGSCSQVDILLSEGSLYPSGNVGCISAQQRREECWEERLEREAQTGQMGRRLAPGKDVGEHSRQGVMVKEIEHDYLHL